MTKTSGSARGPLLAALGALTVLLALGAWMLAGTGEADGPARVPVPASSTTGRSSFRDHTEGGGVPAAAVPGAPGRLADMLEPVTSGPAAASQDRPGEACTITGRVVDRAGRPVPDALVIDWPTDAMRAALGLDRGLFYVDLDYDWDALPQGRTDAVGRFTLEGRELADPSGTPSSPDLDPLKRLPWLLVEHPDFETTARRCAGFHPGPYDFGDFELAPGASAVARVVDEAGRPLAGVTLTAEGGPADAASARWQEWKIVEKRLQAPSTPSGAVRLDGLWPGTRTLTFDARGRPATGREAALFAGRVTDLGEVVVPEGGTIAGRVVDSAGTPLPGAELKVHSFVLDVPGRDAAAIRWGWVVRMNGRLVDNDVIHADDEGRFRFEGLATDVREWLVVARAPGHDVAEVTGVRLGEDDLRLVLPPQAVIRLRVVEARPDGSPGRTVPSATVRAERRTGGDGDASQGTSVPVEAQGDAFLIRGAGLERTRVEVSAPGHVTTSIDLPGAEPGQVLEEVVTLAREATVAGHVHGADGTPIPQAVVTLRPKDAPGAGTDARTARTDAQGAFLLTALPAGTWTLDATAAGWLPLSERHDLGVHEAQPVEGIDLVLDPGARIEGTVTDADGLPARACAVDAKRSEGGSAPLAGALHARQADAAVAVTDQEGRFAFDGLPPGTWSVGAFPGASVEVSVNAGTTAQVALALRRRPRLFGHVLDARGPVSGAKVLVNDFNFAVTDTSGAFDCRDLRTGTCSIHAELDGACSTSVGQDLGWNDAREVVLRFGASSVSGRVVAAEDGSPIADAKVGADPPAAEGQDVPPANEGVTTDADGRFAITRLAAGAWTVHARSPGRLQATVGPFSLTDSGTRDDLVLRMVRACSIEIHVATSAGTVPTSRVRVVIDGTQSGFRRTSELPPPQDEPCLQEAIPPGPVTIDVQRMGASGDWQPVTRDAFVLEAGPPAVRRYVIDP